MKGRWSTPRPGRFTPAKSFGTLFAGDWVGPWASLGGYREHNIFLASPEFEPRTAEPISSRYIDHSIPKATL